MKMFTIVAAFHMCEEQATFAVQAMDYREACEIAIKKIDGGDITTQTKTYDAGPTYVHGVVEGDGDPWDGTANVPLEFTEEAIHKGQIAPPFSTVPAAAPMTENKHMKMLEAMRAAHTMLSDGMAVKGEDGLLRPARLAAELVLASAIADAEGVA